MKNRSLRTFLSAVLATFTFGQPAAAADNNGRDNLMVVLREYIGANKQDEALVSSGTMKARLANGKEIELNMAHFSLIGDMHVRFVFDGPNSMTNVSREQLVALGLSPEEALQLAVANIKRVYGEPVAKVWTGNLMEVSGKSSDLDSSYFLDRQFWRGVLKQHPEGVVAAVPKRGGLLYVPLSDDATVAALKKNIVALHESSGTLKVSAALYLFKDDRWTVFQPAPAQ